MNLKKAFTSILILLVAGKAAWSMNENYNSIQIGEQGLHASFKQEPNCPEKLFWFFDNNQSYLLNEIGEDLINAAERYLNVNGYQGFMKDFEWDFILKKNDIANSINMSNGKIIFSSGMIELAENGNGVAAIMAHMIAHALADHGEKRMKAAEIQRQQNGENNMSESVDSFDSNVESSFRKYEAEADRIGLTIMAIAGYDPIEANDFWQRVQNKKDIEVSSDFLTTHPMSQERIDNLIKWATEARKEAKKYGVTSFK